MIAVLVSRYITSNVLQNKTWMKLKLERKIAENRKMSTRNWTQGVTVCGGGTTVNASV